MIRKFIKLITLTILVACSVLFATSYVSFADEGEENFLMSGDTLVRYTGDEEVIVIPSKVKTIGDGAFQNNKNITRVTFNDGIEKIGSNAFSGCENLNRVLLNDSIISIEDSAFANCINLNYVYFGANINNLGDSVFLGCSSLEEIDISNKNLNYTCIDGCLYDASRTRLICVLAGRPKEYLVMNSSVERIDEYAFWGCNAIKHVSVSNNVKEIPNYCFANSGIVSVSLNFDIESIGDNAFANCSRLEQVYVPDKTYIIQSSLFTGSPKAHIYTSPGTYADRFANDYNIPVIYDALYPLDEASNARKEGAVSTPKPIAKESEKPSSNLFGIIDRDFNAINSGSTLGSTVVVGGKAVVMLDQKKINVVSGPSVVHNEEIRDNILDGILKDKLFYRKGDVRTVHISDECKGIGKFCFARSGLTNINIPEGVESIGYAAFYHCDNLETVTIPASVTSIDKHAFEHTPYLDNWLSSDDQSDYLIVGDGVLLAYKCLDKDFVLPTNVKTIACEVPTY